MLFLKKSRHVDLAHEFINFFLNPDNAYENASVVGYSTPLANVYDRIANYTGDDVWLTNWSRAYSDYSQIQKTSKVFLMQVLIKPYGSTTLNV